MTSPTTDSRQRGDRRVVQIATVVATLIAMFALYAVVNATAGPPQASSIDPSLPNPMGGVARHAPGEVTGEADLDGLRIFDTEVAMGDVGLGITYVPSWQVVNATNEARTVVIGQPQVLEGCCPGPVYVDGELTQAGQEITVPGGSSVELHFPLQMHAGMDGPHHLAIPLESGSVDGALHVTGNFTASASTT